VVGREGKQVGYVRGMAGLKSASGSRSTYNIYVLITKLYKAIRQACSPPIVLDDTVIQNLIFGIFKYIHKNRNIFKFSTFIVLLMGCPVVIHTSIFKISIFLPVSTANYKAADFSENVDV